MNHAWRAVRPAPSPAGGAGSPLRCLAGRGLTFLAVAVAWVFFRAADLPTAWGVLRAMAGANGLVGAPGAPALGAGGFAVVAALLGLAWLAPNTQQLTGYRGPGAADVLPGGWRWSAASPRWAVAVGGLAAVTVLCLTRVSEFIYFQL